MDPIGLFDKLFDMIISADLQKALFPVRITFIIISIVLAILVIVFFKLSSYKNFLILDWWHDFKLLKNIRSEGLEEVKDTVKDTVKEEPKEEILEEDPEKFIAKKKETMQKVEMGDWQRILEKVNTQNELKCKLAVIDADKLLDKELRSKNKELKSLDNSKDLEKVKEYTERLLDKPKKGITLKNTKKIIGVYQKALKQIGTI